MNSLIIEDAMRSAGTLDDDRLGTSLAHSPYGHASAHTTSPDEITSYRLGPEGPIRAVLVERDR